jgi:DNA-binding NarL/FixJ family response regulator
VQPTNIVLLQSDPTVAEMLTNSLSNSFHGVHVATSVDELRHAVAKHRPYAVVVDLESATFAEVEALKHEFAGIRVICNHRVADEEMWAKTLSIGADDCCPSSDMRGILTAAVPQERSVHGMAA